MLTPLDNRMSTSTAVVSVVAALMSIGLVMTASAGASLNEPIITLQFWTTAFGRQAMFVLLAFAVLGVAANGTHRWWRWRPGRLMQPALAFYAVTVLATAATFLPGVGLVKKGARRWIDLGGGVAFQPSELAKVGLVIVLAVLLSRPQLDLRRFFRGVLPVAAVLAVLVGLVGIEDFGTGVLLATVGGLLLIVAGLRWRHLLLLAVPATAAFAVLIRIEPYRWRRLTAFMNIWGDPRGDGYHPIQSLVTIASGGTTGRGLGGSVQRFGFLPEARTDFIFSVICEETGLLGAAVVLGLYAALLLLGWRVFARARTRQGQLIAFGVTALIVVQALINVAVATVCAPTKGISLPLVSAGGSGLIFLALASGLLVSVARTPASQRRPDASAGLTGESKPAADQEVMPC